jgi:hypothetical protein
MVSYQLAPDQQDQQDLRDAGVQRLLIARELGLPSSAG